MRIKKLTFLAAVFAFGFLAVGNVAHSADTLTLNFTTSEGVQGTSFVPAEFFGAGKNCAANPGFTSTGDNITLGGCGKHANHALNKWLNGGYFDPRNGTSIIPPSGDHHRSGWRLMMEAGFSPGSFLTGFAPFLNQFPNFPQVGTPGPSGSDLDLLLLFLDHHGEPLTPGRFPRYIPHERQAWADTLMVKYVSSTNGEFNQSLRSQVGQFRGTGVANNTVTWMSMSDENADGCGALNCIWTFNVGADGVSGTTDDILSVNKNGAGAVLVTSTLRVNSFFAGGDGTVDELNVALRPIEAVPTVIDDRLDMNMTQAGSTDGLQVLRYQIQVVSGPNFAGEEGSDPYTWVICGSRIDGAGEQDCDAGTSDIIDESVHLAYLDTGGVGTGGSVYSQAERFGADGRFFTADDGRGADGLFSTVAERADDTIVACTGVDNGTYTDTNGVAFNTRDCDSDPGADLVYGTSDDGVIFYREAIENGFRSGTRENRAFAFSFLDAQSQLRQIMEQGIEDAGDVSGFLASCLNCNAFGEHPGLDPIGPLNYDQIFPQVPDIAIGDHPPNPTDSFEVVPAP